jgi:FKBP-type peptidyl-prolyl cis-trans isomerase
MGRRGRRTRVDADDFDDTLEQSYYSSNNKRSKLDDVVDDDDDDENNDDNDVTVDIITTTKEQQQELATTTNNNSTATNAVVAAAADQDKSKIEKLRLKKQERKDRKKAKAQDRKNQEEAAVLANTKRAAEAAHHATTDHELVTCRRGVQYQNVILGNGPVLQDRQKVHVQYTLRKANAKGKVIDSSDNFGFRVGRGEVIEGWDIGLEGMRQGGKRRLFVPPEAGYGMKDIGAGKGGMLYFEVTLLSC